MIEILQQFVQLPEVKLIVALILINVVLGVALAIKNRVFNFVEIAQFYGSMVIPYILGYLVFWAVFHWGLIPPETPGAEWLNLSILTVAWAALVGALLKRAFDKVKGLGLVKGA